MHIPGTLETNAMFFPNNQTEHAYTGDTRDKCYVLSK